MKFLQLLCLFLILSLAPAAAETLPSAPAAEQETFPGVAEVIPRSARLSEEVGKAEAQLTLLSDLTALKDDIASEKSKQQELLQRITSLGIPAGWSFDRLQEMRSTVTAQMTAWQKILDSLSKRINEADLIRKNWNDREKFWKNWGAFLDQSHVGTPQGVFTDTITTCRKTVEQAAKVSDLLVTEQKTVTALQSALRDIQNQIDQELSLLRTQTFSKTTHSFFNPKFYRQFNPELWLSFLAGIAEVQKIKWEFLTERIWLPVLQLLLFFALAGFIRNHRIATSTTDEWQFIFQHPWATGIFAAVVSLSAFYLNPPSIWRLGISVLAASSAAILVAGALRERLKIFLVYLLAALFLITQILQLIAFPAPLYRLYLTLLCLLGIPLLWIISTRHQRTHTGQIDSLAITLRIGMGVLLVALFAQATGYSNFSSRLIVSSVDSVYLGIFAGMTIRLGYGAFRFILTHPIVIRHAFFYRYGDELLRRFSAIFKIFVLGYTFLYLFVVWGIYDSCGQTWTALVKKELFIGETTFSLYILLLVVMVLYLALSASWFLCAILDAQIFPRHDFDRGVRDAIKKLLHYFLIFVGFLFAMGLAGFELQNFAVLAGAFGIGIGFGLQNIVNNFVSGIILLFERPVRVGDMIIIDGKWCTVRKIGLRSTLVETFDRAEIIVPNSDLISQQVVNWTLSSNVVRLVIPVGVAYGSDVQKVLAILLEASKSCKYVLASPEPSPIFTAFGESSLDFELRVWISEAQHLLTSRSEILQYLDRRFREEQIEIPVPQRDLHLRLKETDLLTKRPETS
ncbi:MAG: mechanosensitive ion channel, partial [Desulfuromonadaceae bacterium]